MNQLGRRTRAVDVVNQLELAKLKLPPEKRFIFQDKLDEKLISAAAQGDDKEILRLIKEGANIITTDGKSPLYWAAWNGRARACALLIRAYKNAGGDAKELIALTTNDDDGKTAMHKAAGYSSTQTCAMIMDEYAKAGGNVKELVNAKNKDGYTPLHEATWFNSIGTVNLLIEKGADVNAADYDFGTPLILASGGESGGGTIGIIRLLIEKGADVNAKIECNGMGSKGRTALMNAAGRNGSMEKCAVLIEHGADINAKDKDGNTAFYWAKLEGRKDTAAFLSLAMFMGKGRFNLFYSSFSKCIGGS